MKRLAVLLMILAIVLALCGGACGDDAEQFVSGDYIYTLDENGAATIAGYTGAESSLSLPAELDGHPVRAVGIEAFYGNETLVSVSVPAGVLEIGGFAFAYCGCLTSVSLPDGLISIGSEAFLNTALESFTFPETVTTVGQYVLDGCTGVTRVRIPNSVVNYECSPVFNRYMPVEIIVDPDHPVFEVIDGVLFDKTQKKLVAYRNGDMENMSYDIPEGTEIIGDFAFSDTYLVTVNIPDSVKVIGKRAFENSYSLQSVTLPEGITTIGERAFASCESLASINIPDSVTEIGSNLFRNSNAISDLRISPDQPILTMVDGVMFSKDRTRLIMYPAARSGASYAVPEGTEIIGGYAFSHSNLSSITIPDSVTSIEKDAFCFCNSLKEMTIPASVTVIEADVFNQCHALEKVNLPETITSPGCCS